MPDYALPEAGLLALCRLEFRRASGPGGQHLHRTESAVRIVHVASGVAAACSDHRSQRANRASAVRVLRLRLACLQRGGADPAWLAAQVRGGRIAVGAGAQDHHLHAAAALDLLARHAGSLAAAACEVGASTTQLARFLASDPLLRNAADAIRAAHGLTPLRS